MITQLHQHQEAPKEPHGPYTHLGTRCPWVRLWSIPPTAALLKDATSRAVLNLIIIKPAGGGETPGQHSPAQREAGPSTPNCPAAPSTSPAAPFPPSQKPALLSYAFLMPALIASISFLCQAHRWAGRQDLGSSCSGKNKRTEDAELEPASGSGPRPPARCPRQQPG